ncbi:MAG: diphthine--ammonia ligase [Methanomicrobia archaeon]|nr:diphthine--ammonia ligase [Methanomicrobia archaeon]
MKEKKKVFSSWSGGKESCLACYKALSEGFDVSYLLNFVSEDGTRSRAHGISSDLIALQADAIGIPIIQVKSSWESYEAKFKEAVEELKKKGVEGGVFGDMDLQEHKEWVDRVCSEVEVASIEPLWGNDPREILKEFVNTGFKAIVIKVKADLFGKEWVGRELNEQFINDLPEEIHPCGEHGEYHTFVVDGPLFQRRVEIIKSDKKLKDGNWLLGISEYGLSEKVVTREANVNK